MPGRRREGRQGLQQGSVGSSVVGYREGDLAGTEGVAGQGS